MPRALWSERGKGRPVAPRRNKTATAKLCAELRARMVDALLDAAREKRKAEAHRHTGERLFNEHRNLCDTATLHALELAGQHLTLTGDER